mgnify:CR=1 FL=1
MCIALPNTEKTFTVTLFLPASGDISFETAKTTEHGRDLFTRYFPDVLDLVADFDADWTHNPESPLATLYLDTWHHRDSVLLLGDAAHAMVPFHGQGMNCCFEDCAELHRMLEATGDWSRAFRAFEHERKRTTLQLPGERSSALRLRDVAVQHRRQSVEEGDDGARAQ